MKPQDTITIAPSVLITIARQAALAEEGVAYMGTIPVDVGRLLRGNPMAGGVILEITDRMVAVDLYLVLKPGKPMQAVAQAVQRNVKRSIEELVGMQVSRVNIHIEDVDYDAPGEPHIS